ncbi:MAG: hypothetical protein AAGC54_14580, partial [Cyanobacteria bacterium P01_F01_bin.4]
AALSSAPQLWIVGAEPSFTQKLTAEALTVGLRRLAVANPAQAQAILDTQTPDTQTPDGVLLWLHEGSFGDAIAHGQ